MCAGQDGAGQGPSEMVAGKALPPWLLRQGISPTTALPGGPALLQQPSGQGQADASMDASGSEAILSPDEDQKRVEASLELVLLCCVVRFANEKMSHMSARQQLSHQVPGAWFSMLPSVQHWSLFLHVQGPSKHNFVQQRLAVVQRKQVVCNNQHQQHSWNSKVATLHLCEKQNDRSLLLDQGFEPVCRRSI